MAFLDETGLTHLWGKITNKFLAKSNVVNNLTTTSEGYALDARQGVALMNAISGSKMKLVPEILLNVHNGEGFTKKNFTINHDCILYIEVDLTSSSSNIDDEISITIADTPHIIYKKPDNQSVNTESKRCMNYQAFIPAGTTVTLYRSRSTSTPCQTGILATVLYIE